MTNTNVVPQGLFGPGILYVTRTDLTPSTPVNIGYINEFSTDFSFTTKELYGQNQLPLLVARGTGKLTGKMKAATLSGVAMNNIMFGNAWQAGTQYDIFSSSATPIPVTPFQVTPAVPNTGTADGDLGVVNAVTNEPFTLVSSTAPSAANQYHYSSSVGRYVFSSTDHATGKSVIMTERYKYSGAGNTGQNIILTNQPIGNTPTFQIDYKTTLYGATYLVTLFQAVCSKWTMGHKLEDFAMPEFDFSFFTNAAGQVGRISLATQA